ncbi:MAG: GAF domain-containing protein [Chloroflexi bacterium]|nr:GAF domain-containing protein [Chloroflexota bacterium]
MVSIKGVVLIVGAVKADSYKFTRMLKQDGHSVAKAKNGSQALEMMKKQTFDLVLLSISMPEMDGHQFLIHLKADPLLRNIPVIILAAANDLDNAIRCIELGAIDYLVKPINKTLLDARVKTSLERKWLYDQEAQVPKGFLNDFLESLSHPYYIINASDYTIQRANTAASAGKLIEGLPCYEVTHQRDKPCSGIEHQCPLDEIKRTKGPIVVEHTHYKIDGSSQIVEIHGYPILGKDGEVSQVIEYCLDITPQFQMRERLKAIYDLGRELIMLHDEDAIIRRVLETANAVIQSDFVTFGLVDHASNELVCSHGLSNGELIKIDVRLPLGESSPSNVCVYAAREGLFQSVPDISQDPRFIPFPRSGSVNSELCVPLKFGEQVMGVLSVENPDPHSFTASDQQLLQSLANQTAVALENTHLYTKMDRHTNHLATLYEATQDMVSTLDMDSVLERMVNKIRDFFNAEETSVLLYQPKSDELLFVAMSGPSADLLRGQRFPATAGIAGWALKERKLVVEDNVQQDSRFFKDIDNHTGITTKSLIAIPLIHQEHNIGVVEIVNADAESFDPLNLETARGVANSAAIAIRNAQLYRDLQNQMESLQKAQNQLVHGEKMTALGRLVASLAHEINNPLQSIQTYLTLAQESSDLSKPTTELQGYLEIVEIEIERISTLVHRTRDFYRSSDEEMRLIDLHPILDSVLTLSGKQLQNSDVTVEREWVTKLPRIIARADHLKQIFLNLVINAVDTMPDGGILYVRTALDQMPNDNELQSQPAVRIEFSDIGEGIPPENLPLLFEPFYTTKQNGTGMGLYIVYNIIEAHNGQISAESIVGEGTTFTILLPITSAPPTVSPHVEGTPSSSNSSGGG